MFDFGSMIYTVPALLIAITIHEYAHAVTADAMGDPTPRYLGRLTFNPLAHLDILGAVMLALFHFGWAKPCSTSAGPSPLPLTPITSATGAKA